MDNNDFLSQFSNEGKPDSFKQEERTPVVKEKKPINKKLLIFIVLGLFLLLLLLYFIFWAPKIVMPDFIGQTNSDVEAWVKQQKIERTGINIKPVYDFDSDEGTILTQSIPDGKKVKKDVKIDFTVSLGADPDEKIKVPDLASMDKEEIQNWIKNNKLTKTKIMTAYHETIPENEVIDFVYTGTDEDNFTRGSTLKINVSKGPAPAGEIVVEEFEKKLYDSLEAWAKTKKIKIEKRESFSDTVDEGYIISQSVPAGRNMKEGDTLTVVVSKGKAVYMPNMYEWHEAQISAWCSKNGVSLAEVIYQYDEEAKGECIYQSIPQGRLVTKDDYLEVIISLDDADVAEFIKEHGEHAPYDDLYKWTKEKNAMGAYLSINVRYELSDTIPIDHIISMSKKSKNTDTINVVVSDGKNIMLRDLDEITWENVENEYQGRQLCENDNVACEMKYEKHEGKYNGDVIKVRRSDDGTWPIAGTYLSQREHITFYITDNGKEGARPEPMVPDVPQESDEQENQDNG